LSRQLALGGQPVLVAHWAEARGVVEEHETVNRLLLVDAPPETADLTGLVQAAVRRGCALVVCLGPKAEHTHEAVDAACEALGRAVATSWYDSEEDSEAAEDAFGLFTTWVGGGPGVPLLVTEDSGLDAILDAARALHGRAPPKPS
jgi:hypothetical protein